VYDAFEVGDEVEAPDVDGPETWRVEGVTVRSLPAGEVGIELDLERHL
jgi:hypothetical protein